MPEFPSRKTVKRIHQKAIENCLPTLAYSMSIARKHVIPVQIACATNNTPFNSKYTHLSVKVFTYFRSRSREEVDISL